MTDCRMCRRRSDEVQNLNIHNKLSSEDDRPYAPLCGTAIIVTEVTGTMCAVLATKVRKDRKNYEQSAG